ncbi:hypothetical protein VUR80DRAFT_1637 [Thermomyces stellatus]
MKFNQHIAVSTPAVLLVPYEACHVPRYHEWMKDPDIQELTASEPLSLQEEFENQEEWRASGDKLTFILCLPRRSGEHGAGAGEGKGVRVGVDDAEGRMIGDVNLFLYPDDPDSEDEPQEEQTKGGNARVFGEVDVMLAERSHRRHGHGKAAVQTLLRFLRRNLRPILAEYASFTNQEGEVELVRLVAKIKDKNEASKTLFAGLGFVSTGEVNYFGEVEMVLEGFGGRLPWEEGDYEELEYRAL